jgi:hypothetical protein
VNAICRCGPVEPMFKGDEKSMVYNRLNGVFSAGSERCRSRSSPGRTGRLAVNARSRQLGVQSREVRGTRSVGHGRDCVEVEGLPP